MFNSSPLHPSNWNRDERNFYAKAFAGFLFGTQDEARRQLLFECPNLLAGEVGAPVVPSLPRPGGELFVSFDNHLHDHLVEERRSGEFADVAIWGDAGFVTIEAKVADDWNLDKDIIGEIEGARRVATSHGFQHLGHCLLIAERKWAAMRAPSATRQPTSMWNRFVSWLPGRPVPVVFLTWETLGRRAAQTCGVDGERFSDWVQTQTAINARRVGQMPPSSARPPRPR